MLTTVQEVLSQLGPYAEDLASWRGGLAARLTTNLVGLNNDLTYVAKASGLQGKSISIRYADPGLPSQSLSVSVTGLAITVNLATDGTGAITSTAATVKAAIEASAQASALVTVDYAPYNDGTGVVSAMAATNLSLEQETVLTNFILAAQNRMETDTRLTYDKKIVKTRPDDTLVRGVDYDWETDPYDFRLEDWSNFCHLRLRHRPVISVERVRLMYGPEQAILTLPTEWVRLKRLQGILDIVPHPGSAAYTMIVFQGGMFLPLLSHGTYRSMVPQLLCIDYTVGGISTGEFPDGIIDGTEVRWAEHRHMCARLAAREALIELSDIYKPGLAGESVSEDGLSESVQFTRGGSLRYGAMIQQIDVEYERFLRSHRLVDAPIAFTVA